MDWNILLEIVLMDAPELSRVSSKWLNKWIMARHTLHLDVDLASISVCEEKKIVIEKHEWIAVWNDWMINFVV